MHTNIYYNIKLDGYDYADITVTIKGQYNNTKGLIKLWSLYPELKSKKFIINVIKVEEVK